MNRPINNKIPKPLIFLFLFLFTTIIAIAQTTDPAQQSTDAKADTLKNWKRAFRSGLNLNQASFSDNWKGGGVSSIAIGALMNAKANYESKSMSFNNELDLLYGILKNKDLTTRKSTDRIFFDSKLGLKLSPVWSAFVSVNFLSQFDLGYKYYDSLGEERRKMISKFFSPAYLTSSIGFEYKPVTYFWMRIGLGTFRQTIVGDKLISRNQPKNYGVPIGDRVRHEAAFQYVASLDKDIAKNINLKTRFTAFANYKTIEAVDTRLDVILAAKVNKYVNVNITATGLYDQDMDYDVQYSESLALGLIYNFSEFPN
jgi:hypothetical protein